MIKNVWTVAAIIAASVSLTACDTMMSNSNSHQTVAVNQPMVPPPAATGTAVSNAPTTVATTIDASTGQDVPINNQMTSTNSLASASFGTMSDYDQRKLSRALDSAPGKSSRWTNLVTGVSYTVTPIKKVVVGSNQLCRTYQTVAVKGAQHTERSGTACITDDGNWHTI